MPEPKPFMGLAMSGCLPAATIVRARPNSSGAPSGNSSKSLRAAAIHDIGRVSLVIQGDVGRNDNTCQILFGRSLRLCLLAALTRAAEAALPCHAGRFWGWANGVHFCGAACAVKAALWRARYRSP